MKKKLLQKLVGLLVCGSLSWAAFAHADAVVNWNQIAIDTIKAGGHPLQVQAVEFAIVHAAVHDAVQALDGRYAPYHAVIPGATGSPVAAIAKAAHDVLLGLFPAQAAALATKYSDYLATQGLLETDPGGEVGQQAAAEILALRANDGRFPLNPPPFLGGSDSGVWRPTPSYLPGPPVSFASGLVPWMADVTPFALKSPSQFRAGPPPKLSSKRYARDYNEVKAVGALVSSVRTPAQTDIGYFWADNAPVMWNLAVQGTVNAYITNLGDSARLFALINLASADAQIACWETKYTYVFWRPITAIQEGDHDGNRRTRGDPTWQPLINTPNFPEYTSGHASHSSAVTRMLALFFGSDKVTFSVTSANALVIQKTRQFTRFSDAIEEVVDARVYSGIHFRTADTVGRKQGRKVANWVFRRLLRPTHR